MINRTIILAQDSYKYSQFPQYPMGTAFVESYIEARGGMFDQIVYFGLQAFLREFLVKPITMEDVDYAQKVITAHGEPFNREGWEYIVKEHGGKLPVEIRSLAEGTVIGTKQVMLVIRNTDARCYWLTSFLETALLRAIWYPTTVASNSYATKVVIKKFMEETGADMSGLPFKLHDFGARGVSSWESAGLGGMAHLVNFMGSDTVTALLFADEYYDEPMAGYSIPAMEHSTVTSWGRDGEIDSYRNMLKNYGKPGAILAAVSDSYDIYAACESWGTELKDDVVESGATVVIRPDSGDPAVVLPRIMEILDRHFGHTLNAKGFKVLNNVRVIWGDGITRLTIETMAMTLKARGYSADNIAFGQGGALLQQIDRDTCKFAMKCSAAEVNGEWIDVFKDPITDQGKKSKAGRLALVKENGKYETVRIEDLNGRKDELEVRFLNGVLVNETTFAQVRERANA